MFGYHLYGRRYRPNGDSLQIFLQKISLSPKNKPKYISIAVVVVKNLKFIASVSSEFLWLMPSIGIGWGA